MRLVNGCKHPNCDSQVKSKKALLPVMALSFVLHSTMELEVVYLESAGRFTSWDVAEE